MTSPRADGQPETAAHASVSLEPPAAESVDLILEVACDEELAPAIEGGNWIARAGTDVTSQGGEDGVLAKVLDIVGVQEPAWCVEFGACDGQRDSNTWRLINERNWSGVLIEAGPEWFGELVERYRHRSDVHCCNRTVTWEGPDRLDAILAATPIPRDFALLVIDIDGNDYHVWEALRDYRPRVVCIEFHRLISPSLVWIPPRDASLNWPSSLGALCALGRAKGYELVCVINWNAVFVRQEAFGRFGIRDNRPERMYSCEEEMRLFQGYDGTLRLCGNDRHYWKYQLNAFGTVDNVVISQRDVQVLPDGLRVFRPRHRYHCATLAAQAGKLDAARVPDNRLLAHRRNVTSECGEDGILAHLFERLGVTEGFAVDVGACDGMWCSQTWTLFARRGWGGIAFERDADAFDALGRNCGHIGRLQRVREDVACDGPKGLDSLLAAHGVSGDIALLSIDVEGNDYHIWSSLAVYRPLVVVIDFNPTISNDIAYVQAPNARSPFGASLRALIALGRRKRYEIAAVTDWNAIFVRQDRFAEIGLASHHIDRMYYPPFEMRMTQTPDGCLHLLTGRTLVRQDYEIAFEDFQVLPQALRGRDTSRAAFGLMTSCFYGRPSARRAPTEDPGHSSQR